MNWTNRKNSQYPDTPLSSSSHNRAWLALAMTFALLEISGLYFSPVWSQSKQDEKILLAKAKNSNERKSDKLSKSKQKKKKNDVEADDLKSAIPAPQSNLEDGEKSNDIDSEQENQSNIEPDAENQERNGAASSSPEESTGESSTDQINTDQSATVDDDSVKAIEPEPKNRRRIKNANDTGLRKNSADSIILSEDEAEQPTAKRNKRKKVGHIAEADELLLTNRFEDAEDAYRSLIDSDDTGDAHAGLAVALAKQALPKKVIEAERILRKGKEDFSDNPNMMAAAGFVSYIHSKSVASPARRDLYLEAAEALSKRSIRDDPDMVIAQQTLGLVRLDQDDPEGAIGPLRRAAEIADDPVNLTLLAKALLRVDPRDEEAEKLVDEALSMDNEYHPARLQKAFVLTNKGKHEEAYTELHTIPRTERDSEWHAVQGDVFRKQDDGPSALSSWKEANRLNPRNPEPYKKLAKYYSMRGDGELAIAEMHNALEILPNDLRLRSQLAELALTQDKLDVAEQEYRTILSVKQDDPLALLGLSRVYFRKARKEGQYPQGWTKLMDQLQNVITEQTVKGQVVKSGMRDLKEKIQLSEASKALTQNRFREGRQLYSQVIVKHREEPYELLTLGEQAYNDGDLNSAQQAFNFAKEIAEVAPRAEQGISKIIGQRNEAERHTKLGDATWKLPDVAIDHYKQALIADPQHPDAYYGLYKLFFRTKKDDDKAIDYAFCFLEASEDSNPLRKEVEADLSRLKKRALKQK